ncbi:MAG TPA: efflux RND transporter periplasmic adaptor subunit [Anaerolineales bacterium]|nr:efflux RND transporter periplasmic adaptor subunit [Anaerolineales bacterium]
MSKFLKKNRTILIILLVVVVAVAFIFARRSSANTTSQFQTDTLARGNLTATIGATGTVRAKQTAVLSWQAAGTVDTVNVKVGDNLPANFVMAYLQKTSLPQNIILAEADLASAQKELDNLFASDTAQAEAVINLRDAQEAYDKAWNWREELNGKIHVKEIIYKKFGSRTIPVLKEYRARPDKETIKIADEDLALAKAKLDDARREYDRLNNGNMQDIAAAQARLDAAQATINMARVIAPFAGIVTEAHALPGDQVSAGDVAFRVDNLSSLLVDVEVSEVDINSISIDQPVTLTFDAILGREYHGAVVEVAQAGTVENGVVNFTVTVELGDADAAVKPGMTAAVNIVVEEVQDVLLVPNRAVRLMDGQRVVYVLENEVPVQKEITLGPSSDTMSVVAGGDVKEGDAIVLNPPTPGGGPFGD